MADQSHGEQMRTDKDAVASEATQEETELTLVVDPEDIAYVRSVAAEHSVEVEQLDEQGFIDVAAVTLILFGTSLAIATVSHLIEQHKGGQVFDLRKDAPKQAYRSKDIVYGLVQIITADGTVSVEVREPKGMFGQVVDAIRSATVDLGKATIDSVAAATKVAVGDRASVTMAQA